MAVSVMIQGTGSGVGKSVVCAALCRILRADGYDVAPFKSQNMALNSFPTPDGREIGRAQAMQAEATGIEPCVEMNPILIKPTGERCAQIVVMGRPRREMTVKEYHRYQPQALKIAQRAYDKLARRYEVIVIEGAGSPAEINLRKYDIVNMAIARYARAKVIMVVDIDRGGAFAWLKGTLDLVEPADRKLIKGFIINKFRGERSILEPGISWLEKRMKIPCLGVIPWLSDLGIPEEDSLGLSTKKGRGGQKKKVKIGVVQFPHISNFTDFDFLARESDVDLFYLRSNNKMKGFIDMVILPGTKNTSADLAYLRSSGLADFVRQSWQRGSLIFGICGGYQMLGKWIVEDGKRVEGLNMLDITTRIVKNKLTWRVKAKAARDAVFLRKGEIIEGYEIHQGRTRIGSGCLRLFTLIKRGEKKLEVAEGACDGERRVWGTYIHGIMDNDAFRGRLLNHLRRERGWRPSARARRVGRLSYERLAGVVRRNLNMRGIKEFLQ